MITTRACCKINLGLLVTERRPDGYHNLQTVFYPVPLYDEICIEEAHGSTSAPSDSITRGACGSQGSPSALAAERKCESQDSGPVAEDKVTSSDHLTLSGIPIEGTPGDNLVLRAVRLLRSEGYPIPPLDIHLSKGIPNGAGLGGGSSDAARTVVLLNQHYALGMSIERMEQLVGTLGADCPFFVRCQPVYAQGIGNEFSPIGVRLDGLHLVLVKPNESVSTREAYAHIQPRQPQVPLDQRVTRPIEEWRAGVENDFERSVFPAHPIIHEVKERLYQAGATYASMSGSGSSVFGLFDEKPHVEGLFEGMFVHQSVL